MTAAIAQQQEAALRPLKSNALIGYGLGDFGCNLAFTLGSTFLLYYYTDVAGLTAAAVGTMFFVVRLWDAFADLIAGRAVDRTMTRWGKFRPFILFFAVPLLFMSFLTFHVPTGLGDAATLLYVYLTYAVLGLLYSLVNIPYGSLASAMTQSVHQRAKLIAGRTLGAAAGSVLISFIIAPQISALRAQKNTLPPDVYLDQAQGIFTNITLLFILLGSIAFGLTFLWCHETVVRAQPRVTIKETFAHAAAATARSPFSAAPASSTWSASTPSPGPRSTTRPTFSATRRSRSRWRCSAPASRSSSRRSSRSSSAGSARRPCSSTRASSPSSAVSASTSRRTASSGSPCSASASRASGSRSSTP